MGGVSSFLIEKNKKNLESIKKLCNLLHLQLIQKPELWKGEYNAGKSG